MKRPITRLLSFLLVVGLPGTSGLAKPDCVAPVPPGYSLKSLKVSRGGKRVALLFQKKEDEREKFVEWRELITGRVVAESLFQTAENTTEVFSPDLKKLAIQN